MISAINLFILLNCLIMMGLVLTYIVDLFLIDLSFQDKLRIHYGLLSAVMFCVTISFFATSHERAAHTPNAQTLAFSNKVTRWVPAAKPYRLVEHAAQPIKSTAPAIAMGIGLLLIGFLIRETKKISWLFSASHSYKRIANLNVRFSERVDIPFSFWFPGYLYVMLPYDLATCPSKIRLCIAHENQHHRQQDTKWIYLTVFLKTLCFLNPAIHIWSRKISEVQEFACDEALIGRRSITRDEYIGCLIEVAESSLRQRSKFASAASLGFVSRHHLKRRIEVMLVAKQKNRKWIGPFIMLSVLAISWTAWGARSPIEVRSVTAAQAQLLLGEGKYVPKNIRNLEWVDTLNAILNDPIKRQFFREALGRLEANRSELESLCAVYGVPTELLALSLIESGFQNLPPADGDLERSTGIWQMIAQTARVLGLVVDETKDERLIPTRSAEAALRYLAMNRARFDSWELSVLAYNSGERAVSEAIEKTSSRDPWIVKRALLSETQRYYPRWLAAVVLMKNPSLLEE